MLPEKVLEILAIDLGLLVIAGWFLILLFMFREFRIVSQAVNRLTGQLPEDPSVSIYQKSVDEALASNNSNTDTLNQLTEVHDILVSQLSQLHKSNANRSTKEDEEKILVLEQELDHSQNLIKKLKVELVTSRKRLEQAKVKLRQQFGDIETLQQQSQRYQDENQQLMAQIENDEEKNQLVNQINQYTSQQTQLVAAANDYKEKLARQSKELAYLRQQKDATPTAQAGQTNAQSKAKINQLEEQLHQAIDKSEQIEKEKNFLEKKFLDAINELQEVKNNHNLP